MSILTLYAFILTCVCSVVVCNEDPRNNSGYNFIKNMIPSIAEALRRIVKCQQKTDCNLFNDTKEQLRQWMKVLDSHSQLQQNTDNAADLDSEGRSFQYVTTATGYGNGHDFTSHGYNNGGHGYRAGFGSQLQHMISFDPVNIVVSVSLISLILQTINNLLNRRSFSAEKLSKERTADLDISENTFTTRILNEAVSTVQPQIFLASASQSMPYGKPLKRLKTLSKGSRYVRVPLQLRDP